jgi:peptidoglycan/LPS O-acetylase OafA/YrhL
MTLPRLVTWMLVWGTGWALFFVRPEAYDRLGAVLLLGVAPLVMLRPRQWRRDPAGRGTALALMLLVLAFLVLVFVLPPSYRWQFPEDPRFAAALTTFGALVAGYGIAANWRRFVRGLARAG